MKSIIAVLFFLATSVCSAVEPTTSKRPSDTEVLSVWTGYIAGAFTGAQVAKTRAIIAVPTQSGVVVTGVRILPIFVGSAVGAIAGATIGYGAYKAYEHYKENSEEYSEKVEAAKSRVKEVLEATGKRIIN